MAENVACAYLPSELAMPDRSHLLARLGLALPIIQAPMAGVQGAALALAVSNAGGLGSLPAAMLDAAGLHAALSALRDGTTRPWNLNFFCHQPPAPDLAREQAWRALLAPYYREHGIDPAGMGAGPARAPFSAAVADLVEPFRPPVVSFHFGLPSAELLARVKGWGALVLSSATTVAEARWLHAHGADAIIAQGLEAGGHRGLFLGDDLTRQLGTLALLPQVIDAVPLPVIAAGGIADARGVAAARFAEYDRQVKAEYSWVPDALYRSKRREVLHGFLSRPFIYSTRHFRRLFLRFSLLRK
jgi:nitronate monooxygenase